MDGLDADGLRRVHRRAAAERDETVAALLLVERARPPDKLDVGIREDVGEDDRVGQDLERARSQPGCLDAPVRDEERASDAQLLRELTETGERAEAVHDPRRHLDPPHRVHLDAHGTERSS